MTGISRMLDFLTALKVNNDRQWFGVHKEEYNDIRRQCLEEVGVLIAEIERFDTHLAGVAPEQCVYRIYRDIRFSADKSPYKTHFGVSRNLVGINFRHPNVMPNFAVWKTITYRHWHRWCCQPRF